MTRWAAQKRKLQGLVTRSRQVTGEQLTAGNIFFARGAAPQGSYSIGGGHRVTQYTHEANISGGGKSVHFVFKYMKDAWRKGWGGGRNAPPHPCDPWISRLFWAQMALASLVPFQGPKKSRFSGPTLSNAPRNDVAPLKTIAYRAIKITGTLIVNYRDAR